MAATPLSDCCHLCRDILLHVADRIDESESDEESLDNELVNEESPDEELFDEFHSVIDVKRFADKGCPICFTVLSSLDDSLKEIDNQRLYHRLTGGNEYSDFKWSLIIASSERDTSNEAWNHYELVLDNDLELVEQALASRLGPSSTPTSTEEGIQAASQWLKACLESHSKCAKQLSGSHWAPYRLLRLQRDDCRSIDTIFLQETSESSCYPAYLTLSHCWGNSGHFCLDSGTERALKQGISTILLPKTYREAVDATLLLGFEYLWIDSLCILQDSREDWLEQSAQMSRIYSEGVINLAASSSENPQGGMYYERDPRSGRACLIQTGHQRRSQYLCCYNSAAWSKVSEEVLNTRAWVFQERALAKRLLHFTRDQLWWECNENVASEAVPSKIPPKMFNYDFSCRYYLYEKAEWVNVIAAYSECSVSKAEDKLIALSGFARNYANRCGFAPTDYLAGLWIHDLPGNLLWFGSPAKRPDQVSDTDAPSWSWASSNACLHPAILSYGPSIVNIVETHIMPLSDPFGKVIGGHIRLRGILVGLSHPVSNVLANKRQSWSIEAIGTASKIEIEASITYDRQPHQGGFERLIYSLPLMVRQGKERRCWHGLVLQRTNTFGEYRRVGIFDIYDQNNIDGYIHIAEQQTLDGEDFEDVEEHDGLRRYTIRLV